MRKILLLRCNAMELPINTYNIQYIGMGKYYCSIGYDCDLVVYSKKTETIEIFNNGKNKITLIKIKAKRLLRQAIFKEYLNRDKLNEYEYIIVNEYKHLMPLKMAKLNSRAKLIVYDGPYYNTDIIKPFSLLRDIFFVPEYKKHIKYIASKSDLAVEYLNRKGLQCVQKVGVGIDIDRFKETVELSDDAVEVINFMKKGKTLLYIGQIVKRKNFKFLVDVFKEVRKRDPEVKFVIIGKGKKRNKYYVNSCKKKLDKIGENSYFWKKSLPNKELGEIYRKASLFLLPSRKEIFGMVLLESMYFGTPVISSLHGGSKTCITSGENGVVIEKFDKFIWAEQIMQLLNDSQKLNAMGGNAHKTIVDNFTWHVVGQNILNITKEDN